MKNYNSEPKTDLAHLNREYTDEIDLGQLLTNLLEQWKLILTITLFGVILGIAIALLIPKQYRVEATLDKPSTEDIAPLIAQPYLPINRTQLQTNFLKNLQSRDLIKSILAENNLLVSSTGASLDPQQAFSKIRKLSLKLNISPYQYGFLGEQADKNLTEIDQISFSLLSSNAEEAKTLIDGLIQKAANKTINNVINDINGAKEIKLQQLNNQLTQIKIAANTEHQQKIAALEQALATAKALGINSHEDFTENQTDEFLKGSKILEAQLNTLKNSAPQLGSIIIGYDADGQALELSAASIEGQIGTIALFKIDKAAIKLINTDTQSSIPFEAEKPNRKLILIAATLIAGFLGLFIALIRIAVKKAN